MDLAQLWTDDEAPPPKALDVLSQIAHFLDQLGYTKTFGSLYKEAKKNGHIIDIAEWERGIQAKTAIPLLELYEEWYESNDKFPTLPGSDDEQEDGSDDVSSASEDEAEPDAAEGVLVDVEAEETSDSDSDEKSESSDEDDEKTKDEEPDKSGVKRKRAATPSSSEGSSSETSDDDSDSDESSSSDESDARPAKKVKVESSDSSSDGSSGSSSDSSSDSDSSRDSDSDSASDKSASSDSDSSSDSESEEQQKPVKPAKKVKNKKTKTDDALNTTTLDTKPKDGGSLSSATLEADSNGEKENDSEEQQNQIHPDRLKRMPTTKKETAAEAKKKQVPFSRIPSDQKVDPRFASNEYVSYDYADRAHRDLIVTKGKGFTKEKNKKKRGAYRGGMIDLAPKGIKFDD